MITEPIRYRAGLPRGDACIACGRNFWLVVDHCHEHGWVRGTLCGHCNSWMLQIERGRIPDAVARYRPEVLKELIAHRLRCTDCAPSLPELAMGKVWDGCAVREWAAKDGRLASDGHAQTAGTEAATPPVLQYRTWEDIDDGSYSWKPSWNEWEDLGPDGDHIGDIKVQVRVKPKESDDV